MKRKQYLVSEVKFLVENYGRLSAKQCAEKLDRTTSAIYRKVFDLGLTGNQDYIIGELRALLLRIAA